MAEYKCPACGTKMEITFRMPGASEPSPNATMSAVLGTLAEVAGQFPEASVIRAKLQASIDLLKDRKY